MIHTLLKQLRHEHKLTLKQLSEKVGYGTGNLSSYENGKIKASDPTVLRILTRGFSLSESVAKNMLAQWRKTEFTNFYQLAQDSEPFEKEKNISKENLSQFLKENGFDTEEIKNIIQRLK